MGELVLTKWLHSGVNVHLERQVRLPFFLLVYSLSQYVYIRFCDINIDGCALDPCIHGGTCTDMVASFSWNVHLERQVNLHVFFFECFHFLNMFTFGFATSI